MEPIRLSIPSLSANGFLVAERTLTVDYPLHWHTCFEIEYVVAGNTVFAINGKDYPARPGAAAFLTPADLQQIHSVSAPLTVINVMFDDRWVAEELTRFLTVGYAAQLESSPLPAMLLQEYNHRRAFRDACCKQLLSCLLAEIFRLRGGVHPTIAADSTVRSAQLYLQTHFAETVTLPDMARRAGFTPTYFSTLFRKETGESFQGYLQRLRLQHAAHLLQSTDRPVNLICQQAGFGSLAHFLRAFKHHHGVTPQQYRHRERRNAI